MSVTRLYVEKKPHLFDVQAQHLKRDLLSLFPHLPLKDLRLFLRYDVEGLSAQDLELVKPLVFFEPPVDILYEEKLPTIAESTPIVVEPLPGQFDQRADSAAQCVQLITQSQKPLITTAKVIVLIGQFSPTDLQAVKKYCINTVEAKEGDFHKPTTLQQDFTIPTSVPVIEDFITMDEEAITQLHGKLNLAMTVADLLFCQQYFSTEKRNPTITEIKVIDTYWSDHCRHTTFNTALQYVNIKAGEFAQPLIDAYENYLDLRQCLNRSHKPMTLMDVATIGGKYLKNKGIITDLDISEEINACSIVRPVEINNNTEDYLIMFKNETHNHPTEIEPYGGAATCLGGAIRDPLSGRSYVYQAMRISGSGDPRQALNTTLAGKLPQRKISTEAAAGYSSYGNQIGLATGQVREIYHPGYIAKHMEVGAVVGAVPAKNVQRQVPMPGDLVILVGGATGRDGIGGATGSSKEHDDKSLATCGAEVQKGNPPTERKLQRLFRNPHISKLIKRCNDFGAGGVAVAIGELAPGLIINLDSIPKKYAGLDGTELAISESQERMAVVLAPEHVQAFLAASEKENLQATVIAEIQAEPRLIMHWQNQEILNLSRDFLQTNGVQQKVQVEINQPTTPSYFSKIKQQFKDMPPLAAWLTNLEDLNVCSQKGLGENFDSTIGAGTVLMPFGGQEQLTPPPAMVAKIPVLNGTTNTATAMAYGFNPYLSEWSPFHGSIYAIVESLSKIVAVGGDYSSVRLSLQEYFQRLNQEPSLWGKPLAALLGALKVQRELNIPAIGGKDSMSGNFLDLHVPPTLISFALTTVEAETVISPEFKQADHPVIYLPLEQDEYQLPNFAQLINNYQLVHQLIKQKKIVAAMPIGFGGIATALSQMAFGNNLGFKFADKFPLPELFTPYYGGLVLELKDKKAVQELLNIGGLLLGNTIDSPEIISPQYDISLAALKEAYTKPLEDIYPTFTQEITPGQVNLFTPPQVVIAKEKFAAPKVFIPVFPGTNCEYDTAKAFQELGGQSEVLVLNNLSPAHIQESVKAMVASIKKAQIIALPGGFSGGDEPDGSGKFIAAMFRHPAITEAVRDLLNNRDGLMLGICNGFQALIKLGLVPYGDIMPLEASAPTLTFNTLGRHISTVAKTKVVSKLSPWFNQVELGAEFATVLSHGEGRFYASSELLQQLASQGQIATQYINEDGSLATTSPANPNGSLWAIEGITSPDGRILGKMGHSERIGANLMKNIPGITDQKIFASGIAYFK